jgi:hypothetical protein
MAKERRHATDNILTLLYFPGASSRHGGHQYQSSLPQGPAESGPRFEWPIHLALPKWGVKSRQYQVHHQGFCLLLSASDQTTKCFFNRPNGWRLRMFSYIKLALSR